MKLHHVAVLIVVILIGYALGVEYPSLGLSLKSKL